MSERRPIGPVLLLGAALAGLLATPAIPPMLDPAGRPAGRAAGRAAAQGAGSAGAELLIMGAGARATALGGAYTAAMADPDAIFYNPASLAWLRHGAGLGYQAYVQDVTVGSLSGALDAGPVALGGGLLFLDAGTVDEVVPDPDFGGERGLPTGRTVGATEAAARLGAALPLAGGRAAAGASIGVVTSDLAGVERTTAFLDLGAQLRLTRSVAVGASVRNLGPDLRHEELGGAPLPAQARLGASYVRGMGPVYGAAAFADAIWNIQEETLGLALGLEAGLLPPGGAFSAVLRGGIAMGEGEGNTGRVRFGGGVSLGPLAFDYAIQYFEYLGAIHRVGVRWAR